MTVDQQDFYDRLMTRLDENREMWDIRGSVVGLAPIVQWNRTKTDIEAFFAPVVAYWENDCG